MTNTQLQIKILVMIEKYKKSLGQNFLVDENVLMRFVESMELNKDDVVLEVGAGDGRVTKEIAKRAFKVIAVEFDRDLIPTLTNNLKNFNNIEIVNADILNYLDRFKNLDLRFKIVGSIPYSITSPLIHKLLTINFSLLTFIVQLEVAQKIVAGPPKATYLSNLVTLFGKAEIIEKIPPTAFYPVPKVYSAILRINTVQDLRFRNLDLRFIDFLHKGFSKQRKMLNKVFEKELLVKVGIDPSLRPANLGLEEWKNIYRFQLN